jgi:hypothetical protein
MEKLDDIVYPTTMEELKALMLSGEQSKGVNYFLHGEQVADKFDALMQLLSNNNAQQRMVERSPHWRLPKWLVDNQRWIHDQLEPKFALYRTYHTWHDCGKALVKHLDDEEETHYPFHAEASARAWLAAGGDDAVANLIDQDMVCHHLRTVKETEELAEKNPNFLVLMVTAVCEMHVCQPSTRKDEENVCPVDLTTTPGFLIKFKRLAYNGKIMMRHLMAAAEEDV